jgi:glycosyltransferase involved in cell wall biosynthesis
MLQADSTKQAQARVNERPFVSVVTPAYNESQNLPVLFERLSTVMKSIELDWEWIVVDDHSSDDTHTHHGTQNKLRPKGINQRWSTVRNPGILARMAL